MKNFNSLAVIALLLTSCQKELIDTVTPPGGGGGSGSSNGNLLVKAISVTGTDTTTISLKWDANKRLSQYISSGKTNGIVTDSKTDITRESNGNIKKMINSPMGGGGLVDSTVSYVFYQPGTSKITYVKNINYYQLIGAMSDSIAITYNASGKISVKETFFENFITGGYQKAYKSVFTYDGQGNLLTNSTSTPDPVTGIYAPTIIITNTYDSHLAPAAFGDDAYVVRGLSEESVSPNHLIQKVQTGGGTNVNLTMSQFQFNTFDRPTSEVISFTPVPPGYTLKVSYFYQ